MNEVAIYVDMGTTTTRVWLVRGSDVLARASAHAGVRDTARDESTVRIKTALQDLIREVRTHGPEPKFVAACGMITSPLGLAKIPHVPAPAGVAELAASSQWLKFEDVTELAILFIPGVRTGPANPDLDSIDEKDIMRGEETLCMGLYTVGAVSDRPQFDRPTHRGRSETAPTVVLNLGSHWKAIRLDANGRIESSVTSLSGEIIHAVQTQTILASSVAKEPPIQISTEWLEAGMKEQRRSGLSRAFFCVRLLDLSDQGTPEDRLSFLIGTVIASDLDALVARGALNRDTQVVITGNTVIGEAWRTALARISVPAVVLTADESERALIAGFRSILEHAESC